MGTRGPYFMKLFHQSQFERVMAFPPIFSKELEYKCLESGDEMFYKWETFVTFGTIVFVENLSKILDK